MYNKVTAIKNLMKTIKNSLLALCLGLAFAPQSGPGVVPGDTNSLQGAVFLATNNVYPNKTILLVVSDTNTCSACRALASTGLPNPAVLNFLRESFVYWPCGPDEHCTAYSKWLGTGTIPVPQLLMIDPTNTSTYFAVSVGFGGASGLQNLMRLDLQRGTAPYITGLEDKNNPGSLIGITSANCNSTITVPFSNIVVHCRSISTNVVLYHVKYNLNTSGWSSLTNSSRTAWDLPLDPAQIVPGMNVLRFYAADINGNGTQTNVLSFIYNPYAVVQNATTTTLSPAANPTTYGSSVTLTATVTPSDATGAVTFKDGTTVLGTPTLSSGSATYIANRLSAGSHSLSAVYGGDSNYSGSAGATNLTVNQALLTITALPETKVYGQPDPILNYNITSGSLFSGDSLSGSLTRSAGESVGLYAIQLGTLTNSNYALTFVPANLEITPALLGDANNDGVVEVSELNQVFANYWNANTNVYMTNPAALCNGFFEFSLTNISGWNLSVYVSTDLTNWTRLTNAAPVYQFQDPGATGGPGSRFYRLGH
jgi:hypothetical protein